MDSEVDDGKGREERVGKDRVAIAIPTTVVIKSSKAKPNCKRNSDVKRRHAVGKRVNPAEPIRYFRCERVSEGLHFRYGVAGHSNVEEEVKRYGENVNPCDGKSDSVGKPSVVKISEIEHGNIAYEHETGDVEVS